MADRTVWIIERRFDDRDSWEPYIAELRNADAANHKAKVWNDSPGAMANYRVVAYGPLSSPTGEVSLEDDLEALRHALIAARVDGKTADAFGHVKAALKDRGASPWGADGHHVQDVIRRRYRGGETAHELAVDYGCTIEDIAQALKDPHMQCAANASCARNAGHGGICWPNRAERARKQTTKAP